MDIDIAAILNTLDSNDRLILLEILNKAVDRYEPDGAYYEYTAEKCTKTVKLLNNMAKYWNDENKVDPELLKRLRPRALPKKKKTIIETVKEIFE